MLTVPHSKRLRLAGVTVHRSRDLDEKRIFVRRGIPYTDPLRIITDLAGELPPEKLTPIADRALASRMITTAGLLAEIARRKKQGRRGPNQLDAWLRERGFIGGPEPSVLEAQAMRLFHRHGIPVLGREIRIGADGRYRIDFLIRDGLVVEVDGYAHHWTPEAKAYDDTRRNRLRAAGQTVLVYDWRAIRWEGPRVVGEIRGALERLTA